ncbi:putative orphan protein [Pseudoalteromonas translucida]|uniref:Orphan protein n=1 Tax=Pseudoalteromonas translucida (strain TAC 125) TaxID=326442 RepID=Q3IKA8_PSET1|nr:putative orphan protein [Pseudoalteromonas translucida]
MCVIRVANNLKTINKFIPNTLLVILQKYYQYILNLLRD